MYIVELAHKSFEEIPSWWKRFIFNAHDLASPSASVNFDNLLLGKMKEHNMWMILDDQGQWDAIAFQSEACYNLFVLKWG